MVTLIHNRHRSERGQTVILFALLLVAIVAMVGLVLDGGSAFAQRRAEQNASDLAAMAGANAYLLTNDANAARSAALAAAARNGYADATGGVTVVATPSIGDGYEVKVDITAPHHNNFGSVVGLTTWTLGTTATAHSGFPDTAEGAAPMIFSIDAFDADGPLAQYSTPGTPFHFGETNGDVPSGPGDLAWTNYGTGNVNTAEVRAIIQGTQIINKTLAFGEYIGQHNNGNHTALYSDVNDVLSGQDVPVPVVDHNGNFMGWATFHVVSAQGGSAKDVVGYFKSGFFNQRLTVGDCSPSGCQQRNLGSSVLALIN